VLRNAYFCLQTNIQALRNFKELIKDLALKPPIFFPFVGLFHLLWLVWTIWDDRYVHFPGIEWLQVLWLVGYTAFWLVACDLRKWGAAGYFLMTLLDVGLNFAAKRNMVSELYVSNLFLADIIFSLLLLFYYREFFPSLRTLKK